MTSVVVDVDGLDGHAAVGRHRPPGRDVRLVVEAGHDDLVAGLERRPDRPADVERQRRHVGAELDLVRRGGTEEVGDRGVGLGGHRVGPSRSS